ncbi:MAG TPA: GMC family oxidoreductase N-terminal domain-containing protein [Jatrophihabitans sp.]|nr:GMC family oxidoreductase N-terminal domain-containing protein [Jatrophihabitans sp.]
MYDYVIVGAGSAGCVLAARLSEDPTITVCLVEAGPDDDVEAIRIPVAGAHLRRTRYDWDYDTHPEAQCRGRRICLPRGRVLGGTSSINGMVHSRGSAAEFDRWQQPGWSYADLLPYFKRSEANERGAGPYHGDSGPITVSENRSRNPSMVAFLAAAEEAGFGLNDDFNGPSQLGFGFFQLNQRDGMRCSNATAYLHPALSRPNLTVRTDTLVHRVLFDGDTAVGVAASRYGQELELRAEREVIVCGGAYNSPQILQLSGIGAAQLLSPLGIRVVLDQPAVGQNLRDHTHALVVYQHSQPISLLSAGDPDNVRLFTEQRRGPLTSPGPEAGGFVASGHRGATPDLQFHALPVMFIEGGLTMPTEHGLTLGPDILYPDSSGSVQIGSTDPTAKPKIRHNYFAEPGDLELAVAGLRITLEIARQAALKPFAEHPVVDLDPDSDVQLRRYVRTHSESAYHAAGSCAMGTVLDAELRVHGVHNLRVVDASVMPTVFGNPNTPVTAIAERAADLIRGISPLQPEQVAIPQAEES